MQATSQTKLSTPRLSEVARHLVIPAGIVSTGWPAVAAKCAEWGDHFDTWQDGLGRVVLGKRADGKYAATIGGVTLSIARQVAKTFIVGRIIFALCALFPGLKVLWTAHRTRTATNTFRSLSAFAKRKKVAPYIDTNAVGKAAIRSANGEQEIRFRNGSIIMFGAREQGFGRGFDEVDIEVFDEAQILTLKALEDMVAATNQARNPHGALLFYMGTPPRKTDPGEVFTERRAEALALKGAAPDFGEPIAAGDAVFVECSADHNVGRDGGPSLDDEKQWRIANPSYPHRTPRESLLRLRKNLKSDDSWRREGLGVWDEDDAGAGVIGRGQWSDCRVPDAEITSRPTVAIDVSPMLTHTGIVAAGKTADGRVGVEVTSDGETLIDYREGTEWAVELLTRNRAHVWMAAGSAAETLTDRLIAGGCRVDVMSRTDYAKACVNFAAMVAQKRLVHRGQSELDKHVTVGAKRSADEGLWTWGRIKSSSDITLLVAATVAAGALHSTPEYDVLKTIL